MHDITGRILALVLGCVIGYAIARLQYISKKVDHMDDVVSKRKEDERGLLQVNRRIVQDIALIIVVLMTAFAAFSSQQASNKVADNQKSLQQSNICLQTFLGETIDTLNQRSKFPAKQAAANIQLQKDQLAYVNIFFTKPPPSQDEALAAFKKYVKSLTHFVTVSQNAKQTIEQNPFPTTDEYKQCLAE